MPEAPAFSSRPRWQAAVEWAAAAALAALWLAAGLWKLSDITGFEVRLTQLLVPKDWSLPATLALGVTETFAAVLLLVPAWRRWGAWLSALLLGAFMAYIGYHYRALTGQECSCFPWLKRAVGLLFFVEDSAMLAVALAAGWWARPSRGKRRAAMVLAAVAILAGVMLAVDRGRGQGEPAPVSILADGRDYSLQQGRVFLYFFNPSCQHCFQAAQTMARWRWQAGIVGLPTQDFDLGRGFFQEAGLAPVALSPEAARLRQTFPFQDVPFALAIEEGRVREKFHFFEEPELGRKLRQIGFVL